jgi:DNA replicative helicase MCM subunit Mcm2 (Cdc46/Mcm family)
VTNDWVAEAGQLPMADEGYHITDEFDKIGGDDAIKINEALSEGTISLSKANINTKMAARVSEYAIGNPEGDIFDPNEMKFRQLPINDNQTSLKDRFDAIIGLQRSSWSTDEQRERERDKVRKILSRGDSDSEFDVGRSDCVSTDLLVKYIAYAQRVSPELTDDVRQEMLDLYESIKDMEGEDQNLWDTRRVVSVKKLSKAYARLELSESVEKRHVHQANEFLRRCLSSIDFEIGMDDFDELGSGDKRLSQEILETVAELESRGDDDLADVQDLIESLDCSEDRAEDVLDDLKSEGEVFKPEQGKVKQL